MSFISRFRRWFNPAVALAFDEARLWSANAPDGEIRNDALAMAVDAKTRRVLAVGDAARAPAAEMKSGASLKWVKGLGGGTVTDSLVAEARFRHELRFWCGSKLSLAPRVVVVAPGAETAKRALAAALVQAGARDVITLPRPMAAAMGSGVKVEKAAPFIIIVLEEDWAGAAFIGGSSLLASTESAEGFGQIVIDKIAARRIAGDRTPADLQAEVARLRRKGLAADDDAGLRFFVRLHERLWGELSGLDHTRRREAEAAPLYMAGSCAAISGLPALLERTWEKAVTVPDRPEEAMIRGARQVLGELDWVMKSFRSAER